MQFIRQISIRSRLILMLLLVSGVSISAVAWVGYQTGRESLTERIYQQLLTLREDKRRQVEMYFNTINSETKVLSQDPTFAKATRDFRKSYKALEKKVTVGGGKIFAQGQKDALKAYYADNYVAKLATVTGQAPTAQSYLPRNAASRYLQYHYIVKNPKSKDELHSVKTANDGSAYSKVHAKYNDLFRSIVKEFNYANLFLIDAETGTILYSVFKNPDFGTQFRTGPYTTTNLAEAFKTASRSKAGDVTVTDFELYDPKLEAPTAFMAAPITDKTGTVGVLAIELSAAQINELMTNEFAWEKSGLGKTGEVYLVGKDATMRSASRLLVQNSKKYYADLQKVGVDADVLKRIKQHKTSILLQKTASDAIEKAAIGESGTQIGKDYRGVPVLSSYAPLSLFDLNWAIIAEMELSEAYLPVQDFERRVVITSTLILLLVSISTIGLGYLLVKPITDLNEQIQRIQRGNWDTQIRTGTQDEVGELSQSVQQIVNQFHQQSELIEQKDNQFHRLLAQVFPNAIADRIKQGDTHIAETVEEVTILLADVTGFLDLTETMTAEASMSLLNQLFARFDKVAERFGAEMLRTVGDHYMLTCGLATPYLDHDRRVVDCGLELLKVVRRFAVEQDLNLDLAIGIHSGSVTAGLVGHRKVAFDIFGKAVNYSVNLMQSCPPGHLQVSHPIYKRLHDMYEFQRADDRADADATLPVVAKVWRLQRMHVAPEVEALEVAKALVADESLAATTSRDDLSPETVVKQDLPELPPPLNGNLSDRQQGASTNV
ncbi:HAMP domain-containing protein [filamentous cyanobacterium LEGE 11480]|uniref:HAMP domain-containing protein n=1 Tax=Romeriopsis navalis LEGE 11480 TaxID=2777977 RepID=A0A928VK71_9CYAN|nr:adenylate/guanylate cyclase domain-containing protein [Romeriopsis navalis]MBE9029850.1 HAMP domain-containing protein [Romeriopsis navalis LEGE 11480]